MAIAGFIICLMLIPLSSAYYREYQGQAFVENYDDLDCYNCVIEWDTIGLEYINCTIRESCPENLRNVVNQTHGPDATTQSATWLIVRADWGRNATYEIGVPENLWDADYEVGDGEGVDMLDDCFECHPEYVNLYNTNSVSVYCAAEGGCATRFSKYTGRFAWAPVREITDSKEMVCTMMKLPDGTTTHEHCFLDWASVPIELGPAGTTETPEETTPNILSVISGQLKEIIAILNRRESSPRASPATRAVPIAFCIQAFLFSFIIHWLF
ncbi:uncharacterized protein LOC144436062 isoform X2 [Glandiceps talaboti]